jgi:hypothetical protein
MDNQTKFLIIGIVVFIFICVVLYYKSSNDFEAFVNNPERDDYCPRGYCGDDLAKLKDNDKFILDKFHSNKKSYCLGYDNPYIYPYNYNLNLNHPIDKFKFPGWIRQIDLDVNNYDGFPGYVY